MNLFARKSLVPKTITSWIVGLGLLALVACSVLTPNPTPLPIPGVVTLYAQTLPITKTLTWIASANADSYVVTQDGTQIGTPTAITQPITITTVGSHTFTVAAKNIWGTSAATPLTVNVVLPSTPTGLGIQ